MQVAPDGALRPFAIVHGMKDVELLGRKELELLVGADALAEAYGRSRNRWSGISFPVDSKHIIILNDSHSPARQAATLMEEIFHRRLKHRPSKIYTCPVTGLLRREYAPETESEAYGCAAAALVPYAALRTQVERAARVQAIAEHFEVSIELVEFRLKVNRLWRKRVA
jgi:Zn-dependent peptidase ImmA (M78 family)